MKILIIRLSSLGDIVLTQPIAAALRARYPKAQIDFITKPAFHTIVEKFDCIDNIINWDESLNCLKNLNKSHYDLCIDLHAKFNTLLIKTFCHAKQTVTYSKKHNLRKAIVKHRTDETISSTVQLYYSALEKAEIPYRFTNPQLFLKDQSPKNNAEKTIGIFPGATYKTKQYPPEKIIDLINLFQDDWQVILFGSASEAALSKQISASVKRPVQDLCGKLNLDQLCSQIASLDLVISNDSGPMHIAAALDKPQIAIFGATDPALGFAPLNPKAVIFNHNISCKPCSLHGAETCPLKHFKCMLSLDNIQIYQSIQKTLS